MCLVTGTYMQSGPKVINGHNQGVNYRALGDLFNLAAQRRGAFSYEISVQMIEIYNEQVRDLLVSDGLSRRYPFNTYIFQRLIECSFGSTLFILFSIFVNFPCNLNFLYFPYIRNPEWFSERIQCA